MIGSFDLRNVPEHVFHGEAAVFNFGAKKHGLFGWVTRDETPEDHIHAAMGHMVSSLRGEEWDPETGYSHLSHARSRLGIALDLRHRERVGLDRPPQNPPQTGPCETAENGPRGSTGSS